MITDLYIYWCYFGAGLALLVAISQLYAPEHLPQRKLFATIMLIVAIIQFNLIYFLDVGHFYNVFLYYLNLPLLFLIGPLMYFYFKGLSDHSFRWHRTSHSHLLPAIVIGIFSIVRYFGTDSVEDRGWQRVFWVFAAAGYMYYAWLIRSQLMAVWHPARIAKIELQHLHFLSLAGFCNSGVAVVAGILGSELLFGILAFSLTLVTLIAYLVTVHYPEFPMYLQEELQQSKSDRTQSHLKQVNLAKLRANFDFYLEEEQIYRDKDLTLNRMADRLDVSPRQLTEFLTRYHQTHFTDYIEKLRIEEAKELLVNDPDRGVLDIGLYVGFRSTSAFYTAFRLLTDMSPGQYREAPPDKVLPES